MDFLFLAARRQFNNVNMAQPAAAARMRSFSEARKMKTAVFNGNIRKRC
ncbi:MAG: hypothetical protein KF794_13915 [Xanthobacteraceae bacterium]|nr:hypothetical protein [Xanthobacteraceae bacterium]QYK44835.1 MAG: hypothetical protein KF794_13915 [Xanthobacteraceae bacterium]